MKLERPRQSKFMGHVYKIKYQVEVKSEEGDTLCGETDNNKCTILIEEGMPATKERETLLHEVIHQLRDNNTLPYEQEEALVTHLGAALNAHIADNPLFWRYVTRRIQKDKDASN